MRLVLIAAAWLAGVLLGLESSPELLPIYLLLGAVLPLDLALRLSRLPVFPAVLAALFLLGLWRTEAAQHQLAPLTQQYEQLVSVQGSIIDDPEGTSRRVSFTLEISGIDRGEGMEPGTGRVLVYAGPPAELVRVRPPPYFRFGDRLVLSGMLEEPRPFEGFDYPAFLAAQGITGVLWSEESVLTGEVGGGWRGPVYSFRRRLSSNVQDAIPYPPSSVVRALLLGQRPDLPPDLVENFRDTGAAYLLAISGLHVGILLFLAVGVSAWALGRRRQYYLLFPLVAVVIYALVSGRSPSVFRAAIIGAVYLAALELGRPNSTFPALALSWALMTAVSPDLLQRASFRLSFAAIGGIALAQSYLGGNLLGDLGGGGSNGPARWQLVLARPVIALAVISLAATLATWPLVAFHFGEVALLGVPVTLLAVPVMPLILIGGLTASLAGFIHPALGQVFGWMAWAPTSYLTELVSAFPGWTLPAGFSGKWLIAGWYGTIAALLVAGRAGQLKGFPHRGPASLAGLPAALGSPKNASISFVAAVLAVAATVLWLQVFGGPDGDLHVRFFDVGQGDSILIETPDGRQVLIDGAPGAGSATLALAGTVPSGDLSLDLLVLTHLDADHSRGLLKVLDQYQVGAVLVGRDDPEAALYPEWRAGLSAGGTAP